MELRQEYGIGPIERSSYMFIEGKAEGRAEGRAEGLADGIRAILRSRGLSLPKRVDKALTACNDPARLTQALIRAQRAERSTELLELLRSAA